MTGLLSDCRAHGHNDLTAKAEMTLTNWANRRFEFAKSRQLFIRSYNETVSVAAVRVGNPDCRPHSRTQIAPELFLIAGRQMIWL
jgi:hypothetical protein